MKRIILFGILLYMMTFFYLYSEVLKAKSYVGLTFQTSKKIDKSYKDATGRKNYDLTAGETLNALGWREDQSCLRNSAHFRNMHPVLTSSTKQAVDVGLDGYFSAYPANTNVLLRRNTNNEPALLYYKYGQGTVVPNNSGYPASKARLVAYASSYGGKINPVQRKKFLGACAAFFFGV